VELHGDSFGVVPRDVLVQSCSQCFGVKESYAVVELFLEVSEDVLHDGVVVALTG
jgi:hypothetical protein